MKIIYQLSKTGIRNCNEDIVNYVDNYAWVIDGATDVFQANIISVQKYVNWLNTRLKKNISGNTLSLNDLLLKSISEIYLGLCKKADFKKIPEYLLPNFAICLVLVIENTLYYYILGDCEIAYKHNNKINLIQDTRIEKFELENSIRVAKYKKEHNCNTVPLSVYQNVRMKANTIQGYPIGSVSGKGIPLGILGKVVLNKGDRVLLYSDGLKQFTNDNHNKIESFMTKKYITNNSDDTSIICLEL